MVTKFIFQLPGAGVEQVTNGFNINNIPGGGNNGFPSEIQLRNVTKCSIDAYSVNYNDGIQVPSRDGLVRPNTSSQWGCASGDAPNFIFGNIFSGNGYWNGFPSQQTAISGYTATPSYNSALAKNYCAISLNLLPGKNCRDVIFGDQYDYFNNSANVKITEDSAISTVTSIKVVCGSNTIDYPVANSTVTLNRGDSSNPQLEFTQIAGRNMGCQYQAEGDNYMSFLCNAAGGVDAVQYKCGL